MGMPSQEEQDLVEAYVLKRPLVRPNTTIVKALFCCLAYGIASIALGDFLLHLFSWLGIPSFLGDDPGFWSYFLYYLLVFFITGLLCLRKALIGCVKLYQRYAPEDVRRRCLMMPTCSEYAILVLQKYGVIRGVYKIYVRLFKKCVGNIYWIDNP